MLIFGINLIFAEVIILKDDSVIKGKITKLDEDIITVIGSFGEMVIERDNVKKQYANEEEYSTICRVTSMNGTGIGMRA